MTNNRRFSENRMSIESGITFSSLLSKEMFDGEELVDAFKASSNMSRDSSLAPRPLPPKFITAKAKRQSENEYNGQEIFSGQDLADIFEHQQNSDRDASMRMSITSRRFSSISKNDDRRESIMSLMSLADSILENPSQMEDTLDMREKSNKSSNSNGITNSNSSTITANNNDDDVPVPSTVTSYSSTQKVVGNRIDYFNNDIDGSSTTLTAATFPSTVKVEENNTNNNEEDDRTKSINKIGPYDIICGRNNGAHNWVGNRRFRVTIMMHLKRYTAAPTREEKTHVIKSVIDLLMDKNGVGARFIKKVGDGTYERLKDKQIREKVGHAFRDMMSLEEKGADELEAKCFR